MIGVERVDHVRGPVTDIGAADHFAAAEAKLEAAGIEVAEMWGSGVCNGAGVSDPSGNILLHRRYAPYPDGTAP